MKLQEGWDTGQERTHYILALIQRGGEVFITFFNFARYIVFIEHFHQFTRE